MAVIIATPAGATSNCYETKAEADAYFAERLPLSPAWEEVENPEAALIMATRTINVMFQPQRTLVRPQGEAAYYLTRRQWTGAPSTSTQRLAWPRTGMYNRLGVIIPSGEIPYELKEAVAELAGQLNKGDRTLDNDVIVQGLTSVKAGSVALSFKDAIFPQVLPDAVLNLLPPSWITDELITSAQEAVFEVF